MPKVGSVYNTIPYQQLRSKSDDVMAYPKFLHDRASDYETNAKTLYKEAERAHSLGHITESNKLLKEAKEVEMESHGYNTKLLQHTLETSRKLRQQSQLDAKRSALEFEKRIKKEEGEPINSCTPIKIIRENINELFIELTDYPIFDSVGKLSGKLRAHTAKGIIGALLYGFDDLQADIKASNLLKCKRNIAEKALFYINNIEDDLEDYFRDSQSRKKSITHSISRTLSSSTKSLVKSVKNAVTPYMMSKSGKSKTKVVSTKEVTTNIASYLGWDKEGESNYFPIAWLDATTSDDVKDNFILFCNKFMNDIELLYNTVKSQTTDCREVLDFVRHKKSGMFTLGGKSRKRNKRKSQKNKNK